jgi:Dolichyl-phosphate-mannose-protein mannosyltransferase
MSARSRVAVAAALALYAALAIVSSRSQSAVFDEPIHLPPGYANLVLGDHRMNPDHPPLLRVWAAAPLLFLPVSFRQDDLAWRTSRPWEFGKRFLYRWNDADRLLFWGRMPVVALGVGLGLALFAWTRRQFEAGPARLALFLYVLNPDMLAHGRIVTNDLAIAFFIFVTVIAFERLTERVTWGRFAWSGLALGAALATKFSGAGLLPILGLLALINAILPAPLLVDLPPFPRNHEARSRLARIAVLGLVLAGMAVVAVVVVWAAYGFRSPLSPEPAVAAAFDWSEYDSVGPLVRVPLLFARRAGILPEAWVYGFLHFVVHAESRPAFLLGEYSETGWWYYFPVTFVLKTPVPLLILIAVAVFRSITRPAGLRRELFLWLPALFFFAITMTRNINIGHRHLLPVYPFLFVAAGRAAVLAGQAGRLRPTGAAMLLVLAGWYALGTLRVHPHYLAYFNELAGGPRNGYRRLVDSNLDWGQGLKALKAWMDASGVRRIKLCYFGTADPEYHGIDCDRLPGYQPPPPSVTVREVNPGDIVAVSATHLQGVYLDPAMRPLMELLRSRTPIGTPGFAIFVYRADFSWAP